MTDTVAFLRNRAEDERRAGNDDISQDFDKCADEIELLRKQCKGLANAALNNGQGLLLYERALEKIKELSDSEDGEPLDDAIRIAEQALAFKAPELNLDR